jgi:hypothetical protein
MPATHAGDSGTFLPGLNLAAGTTVVKAQPGRLVRLSIITAASTGGSANDCKTTAAVAIANQVLTIPANALAGTIYELDWPMLTGITIVVGTSGVIACYYA